MIKHVESQTEEILRNLLAKTRISSKRFGPYLLLLILTYPILSLVLLIRPNADDFSALGRASISCEQWSAFAARHGESSIGFNLIAKLVFCTGASENLRSFQIMGVIRFLIMLVMSVWISRLVFKTSSLSKHTCIGIVIILLTNTVVTDNGSSVRQYLGFNWTMQWIQHSLAFWFTIIVVILVARNQMTKRATFLLPVFFLICSSYSLLTFVYVFPFIFFFYREFFRNKKISNSKKIYGLSIFLMSILILGLNVILSSRGQRAFTEQNDSFSLERFLGLAALSVRENLIVNLWPLLFCFLIGIIFKDEILNSIQNERWLIYFYVAWVSIALFIVEYFTYFAIWHHTTLLFLYMIMAVLLGSQFRKIHLTNKIIKNFVFIVIVCVSIFLLSLSLTSMSKFQVNWDKRYLTLNISEKSEALILPLNLGIRENDPFWPNYAKRIQSEKPLAWPILNFENLNFYGGVNPCLDIFDGFIRALVNKDSQANRITNWLI